MLHGQRAGGQFIKNWSPVFCVAAVFFFISFPDRCPFPKVWACPRNRWGISAFFFACVIIGLHLCTEKRYKRGVPICLRCNSVIHLEAKEQCPACGYSLKQQELVFGKRDIVFPRVLDYAGVLLQQERNALLGYLADLERSIPPVALCIYLTHHGQAKEFRSHAHWILNHAHIHTPSFGKREGRRAIEDAELRELQPGDTPHSLREEEPKENVLVRAWKYGYAKLRDRFTPCPPPVRHEWMLILVVDVQLKMACFSWGYMLDPYINPDKINSCITAARLQFRERANLAALQLVMKKAVAQIAASARRVNRTLAKSGRTVPPMLAGALGLSLLASPVSWAAPAKAAKPAKAAAPQTLIPEQQDDVVAEEVAEEPAAPVSAAPAAAPATPADAGAAACYTAAPRWNSGDHKNLMEGKFGMAYNLLLPGGKAASPQTKAQRHAGGDESDITVPGRYCPEYKLPGRAGLCDPQGLLSDVERTDVEHILREYNAHSPFTLYAAVFKAGQSIPQELNAGTLVTGMAKPCEYAAVILYSTGDTPEVQLGYQQIVLDDEQQRERLLQARQEAAQAGGGADGLIAAIRYLHGSISPMAADFRPVKPEAQANIPLIHIEMKNAEGEKEKSLRDRFREWTKTPEASALLIKLGIGLLLLSPVILFCLLRRRVVRLIDTKPDIRLSSPYGAGVSRYVRYLDGKEAPREKSPV